MPLTRRLPLHVLTLSCLVLASSAWAQPKEKEVMTEGTIEAVTLYRGQALVTRKVPVAGPAGLQEIVVTGLPDQIVNDSLFAEGDGLEVRAVRYRDRAVAVEPMEALRDIEAQIKTATDNLAKLQRLQQLYTERGQYLDKLEGFVGQVGKEDLTKATLDAEALQKLSDYIFEQRKTLVDQQLQTTQEIETTQQQIALLQRKKGELGRESTKTIREAVLFLSKTGEADGSVALSYLVNQAGWSPAYNVRANTNEEQIRLEYNALIYQMTGEDWSKVALTLSTATPALSSATPSLAPFRVSLSAQASPMAVQVIDQNGDGTGVLDAYNTLNDRLQMAQVEQNRVQSLAQNFDNNWKANTAVNGIQIIELVNSGKALEALKTGQMEAEQQPSIDYKLEGGVSLASRSDQQMVRILSNELPTNYYHVATPLLSQYVYREAELKNITDADLLAGPVTCYLNGRFVGKSELPTVARGEQFVLGLGADSQLRAKRVLVKKDEDVQGGNRKLSFTYRVVLENFKEQAVTVRAYDRLPVAAENSDIIIALSETGKDLSDEAGYVRSERPKGILRWDIEVPAEASADDALDYEYTYSLEFDRQMHLTSKDDGDSLRNEFEQLERFRGKF